MKSLANVMCVWFISILGHKSWGLDLFVVSVLLGDFGSFFWFFFCFLVFFVVLGWGIFSSLLCFGRVLGFFVVLFVCLFGFFCLFNWVFFPAFVPLLHFFLQQEELRAGVKLFDFSS